METAVAVQQNIDISMSDIKKYIAPKATDKELFMFMGICKSYNLNPMKKEIHFIKYGDAAASIIVGYEIYLKRAERTGKLDGWKCWIEKDDIGEKAVIEIHRKDQSVPLHWEVYRKEFDKGQATWKASPTFMLKKVCISQGMRLAFPDELGGMPYIAEEMTAGKVTEVSCEDVSDEPVSEQEVSTMLDMINSKAVNMDKFLEYMKATSIETIPAIDFKKAMAALRSAKGQVKNADN